MQGVVAVDRIGVRHPHIAIAVKFHIKNHKVWYGIGTGGMVTQIGGINSSNICRIIHINDNNAAAEPGRVGQINAGTANGAIHQAIGPLLKVGNITAKIIRHCIGYKIGIIILRMNNL